MIDIFKPALSLQNMHGHYQNINISQRTRGHQISLSMQVAG